jgi:ribosomal protein S18 acetylase RimI-like enzyme
MGQGVVLRMRRELRGEIETPRLPPGVSLRALTTKPDKTLVQAAHAVLEAGFWEGGGGAPIFRQWWNALRKDDEFDPALVFLAMDSEGVAGMAQCWTSAFVKDLAVRPRARRRGIGRALMLAAFHAFARRGATHVDLKVREENEPAIALYRSLDMHIAGRDLS